MAEMLLINPRRRRRASTAGKRRRAAPVKRRTTRVRRRRNPLPALSTIAAVRRRRANPLRRAKRRASRRRRNPIGLGRLSTNGIMGMLKDAAIGGAGSVGVDFLMGQVQQYLPPSMRKVAGSVGVYDAVKAGITIALGHFLAKPTKGLSRKMAQGALTVQAAGLIKGLLPAELSGGLGFYSPAQVTQGSGRIGPRAGVNAYGPGRSPLLSGHMGAYGPARTPLLSGAMNGAYADRVRAREGITIR